MRKEILSFKAFDRDFVAVVEIPNIHRSVLFLEHGDQSSFVFRINKDWKNRWFYEIYSKDIPYLSKIQPKKIVTRIYSPTAEIVKQESERLLCDFRENKLEEAFSRLTDSSELQLTIGTDAFVLIPVDVDCSHHPYFKDHTKIINNYLDFEDVKKILDREDANQFDIGDRWIEFTFYLTFSEYKKLVNAALKNKNLNLASGIAWKAPAINE